MREQRLLTGNNNEIIMRIQMVAMKQNSMIEASTAFSQIIKTLIKALFRISFSLVFTNKVKRSEYK